MKKSLVLALLAFLAISSCQKPETKDVVSADKVFTATMEAIADDAMAIDTKTSLDANGNVRWKQGDQVSLFAASTINEHYQVTDASNGKTTATLYQVTGPGFVAGGEIPNNVAFYPYTSTAGIAKSGGSYVISDIALPATQNYASESFGSGAFPMAAVTTSTSDTHLKFKNVLGGLKLQLKGTATITSISVAGNSDEKLCGAASVTVSSAAAPSITLTDATATTVTLDCGDGIQLNSSAATAFIIALPPMTMSSGFAVTVTDTDGGTMEIRTSKSQTITRSNLLKMPAVNYEGTAAGPVAVDLGLPSGLKWASFNLGATAPEEYGDYFAWGETEPHYTSLNPLTWKDGKNGYTWATYKWCEGSYNTQTKYCINSAFGSVDNKTVLDPEDDAAHVNWGGTWRMPTDEEWTELRTECTWEWTSQNGAYGRLVTGPNNNSIFLPAAGSWFETDLEDVDAVDNYWSSSLSSDSSDYGWCAYSDFYSFFHISYCRFFGQSVRPVMN